MEEDWWEQEAGNLRSPLGVHCDMWATAFQLGQRSREAKEGEGRHCGLIDGLRQQEMQGGRGAGWQSPAAVGEADTPVSKQLSNSVSDFQWHFPEPCLCLQLWR